MSKQFIAIDEEGYFLSNGLRTADLEFGRELLKNLYHEHRSLVTTYKSQKIIVEAFDCPLVASSISLENTGSRVEAFFPYGYSTHFDIRDLKVDEWDRFTGKTEQGISFVLSRSAQMQLFNYCDEFDDQSITIHGQRYLIPELNAFDKSPQGEIKDVNSSNFWNDIYVNWKDGKETPGWERGEYSKTLSHIIPQLKLSKSRIAVLGCGCGHEAAYLASLGHIVTAVDISSEAIKTAQSLYGNVPQLKFIQADAFSWAKDQTANFDIVFEHTFFCAIDPDRRTELVSLWKKMLIPGGHLLAILFAFDRMGGPPFGASEWEIRERLKSSFNSLYWTRWKTTEVEKHLGIELVVYAQKISK